MGIFKKKLIDPYKYWRKFSLIETYYHDEDNRTNFLVTQLARFIDEQEETTLHEFGCTVGRNLRAIQIRFPQMTVTGNDICRKAIIHRLPETIIYEKSTDVYLEAMAPVDYIITMAHLIHLPNEMDASLKKYVPKKCNRLMFCFEQNREEIKVGRKGVIKYPRNFDNFFGLKIIDKIPTPQKEYSLWIYELDSHR